MIIKRMRASFGCLEGQSLDLKEGLNVILAPNESGKSTWCAFLRAMLYGVDSAERAKGGRQPDRLRHAPWSGAPMEGEMDLIWRGEAITLRRRTRSKNAPMRDFSATYTGAGEAVPALTGQNAGECLTGVTAPVFRRSAFIGQGEISVTETPELEKRINTLVTSGEEGVSFSEAAERLQKWRRLRFHNRKVGAIPALEEETANLQARLDAMSGAAREREDLLAEARQVDGETDRLGEALRESAAAGAAAAAQRRSGRREAVRLAEEAYAAAVAHQASCRAALEVSAFGRTAPDRIAETAEADRQAAAEAQKTAAQSAGPWPGILFLALAGLWIALGVIWNNYFYSGGVGFLLLAFWAFRRRKKKKEQAEKARRSLDALREKYGTSEPAGIAARVETYTVLQSRLQEAAEDLAEAEAALEEARTLLSNTDRAPDPESDRLRGALLEAQGRAETLQRDLARATGRLSALGDPVELRSGLLSLMERREALVSQYDAIELALCTLQDADAELRGRFSPALSRRAGALMERLTDGRYGALVFDRDFAGEARLTGAAAAREAFYLSAGAADLAYLCLRLAVCELALPGEDPCPLVLDDVLVNLDDDRAAGMAALLRELAQTRQILFFTCRARDAALLRGEAPPAAGG